MSIETNSRLLFFHWTNFFLWNSDYYIFSLLKLIFFLELDKSLLVRRRANSIEEGMGFRVLLEFSYFFPI